MKIVLYDIVGGTVSRRFLSELQKLGKVSFIYAKREFDGTLKPKDLAGADILVTKILDNYGEALFSKADRLKFIASMHVDTSTYALHHLRKRGVTVSNAKGYCTEAVAELAISAMLSIVRRTHEAMKQAEKATGPSRSSAAAS